MKKIVLIAIILVAVFVGGFVVLKGKGSTQTEDENAFLRDIPVSDRPFTSLTPKEDGHWLKLHVDAVKISDARSMEYLLEYSVPGGATQGVPGTIALSGTGIDRDLLLGSESSGKFRYDDGVENGTLTLRFRNDKAKLIGKLSTDFHLQKDTQNLSTKDGYFKYTLDKPTKGYFFVTMNTLGLPKSVDGFTSGPNGVFASKKGPFPGQVTLGGAGERFDGNSWVVIKGNKSIDIGVFIGIGE